MSTINNFRNDFKEYIKKKLQSVLVSYKVHIGTDINFYLDGSIEFMEEDVIIIISNGNFTRSSADQMNFFNGSVSITIYCALNYKDEVFELICPMLDEMSELGYIGYFGDFKASFNFNTPASDGIMRVFSGVQVGFFNIYGTVTYCSNSIDAVLNIPTINIIEIVNEVETEIKLENVYSYSPNSAHQSMDFNAMGNRFIERYEDIDSITYSISLIIDKNKTLHQKLLRATNKFKNESGDYYSNRIMVEIKESDIYRTGKFETYLQLSTTYNIGNFSVLNIVITR